MISGPFSGPFQEIGYSGVGYSGGKVPGLGYPRGMVSREIGYPGKGTAVGTHPTVNAFEFLIYCH